MSETSVLLIDDEPTLLGVLANALGARGYDVAVAPTGAQGLQVANDVEPDVFIVDLGLPDIDGIEVCRQVRRWTDNPIIVLTVDDGENRKVEAFDAGADDYVTKPFSMPELLARVRVAVRHRSVQSASDTPLHAGNVTVDVDAHRGLVDGRELRLTPKEFALIAAFARNAGRLLRHDMLIAAAWDTGDGANVEMLRTQINGLRRKLEQAGATAKITTEPGLGYRFVPHD